jgi:uncharacterized RDD family membrane protein YckC
MGGAPNNGPATAARSGAETAEAAMARADAAFASSTQSEPHAGTADSGARGFAGTAGEAGRANDSGFSGAGGTPDGGGFSGAGGGTAGPPPTNGTADALSLPRAGFWIRILALLIDAIIVGVVFSALDHDARPQLIALAAYGAIMWKLKGTTIGGIVCNLKIVRLDGRPVDWSTAIVRALGCFLSLIVCGLGFIWIAFDPGRQAWHDKIAGTAVVRVPQGVSLL